MSNFLTSTASMPRATPWVLSFLAILAILLLSLPAFEQVPAGWVAVFSFVASLSISFCSENQKSLLAINALLIVWIFVFAWGNGLTVIGLDGVEKINSIMIVFLSIPAALLLTSIITAICYNIKVSQHGS